jgi:hypothetical protein
MAAAETMAHVANALGLQNVQFSWAGRPQAMPGSSAEQAFRQQQPEVAKQTQASGASNSDTAAGSTSATAGDSTGGSPGQIANRAPSEDGDATQPAAGAAGDSRSTLPQQQEAEVESSEHSEL